MAAYYPDKPTSEERSDMTNFFTTFSKFYPCSACAEDFREQTFREFKMATIRVLAISAVLVTVMSAGDTPCPNSCSCPSRYRADCCNSSLTRIPKNLVSDLRFLNASGNNFRALRQGNFSATNVRQLKILDLSNNKISTVETGCLSELEELIFLYLSRNEIAVFSQDVFGTNRRLEFLKLDKNILDLPIGRPFLDIPSLRSLDMASCNIESLPEKTFIRVPNLEELRLSHNRLQTLDRKTFLPLRSLKSLLLSDNLLRTLQEDLFVTLKELTYLDLSDNQLQELHPQVFTFMESVEHLDLSGNRLKALEIGVFTPLTSLKRLHLHRNVLNSLNERQFSELNNLALLDLSGNHLEHVQFRIICHLNNLTYLKLSDNRLSCNCALWELWNWSLENGVRILSTCEESDFEFSVKNFEFLRVNNSCNATLCDIELETEYSEGLISAMYIYVIICVGLLLVLIACFFTTFVVFRYRKEFCKRRNIQVSALEFSQNTITYVERQHEEYILHAQRQRELQEELRRQHNKTLMRNRLQIDQSTSLKILPRTEHRNLRHSYHECRLPSVADDEREWCNADTLPSNNRTSVFLASMSSHPIEQEPTPKNISRSEPKLKDYSKNLSVFNGTDSKSDIIPLSVSSLKCQPPREAPKFENIHDVSSSESETVEL